MAIRIIKEGKKTKFTKTCPDCGCEFEYELEDLQIDYTIALTTCPVQFNRYVVCPYCGKHIHHDHAPLDRNFPEVIYTNTDDKIWLGLDCNKCPNKPDPNRPITAGDTPCTWCPKMQPTCVSKE